MDCTVQIEYSKSHSDTTVSQFLLQLLLLFTNSDHTPPTDQGSVPCFAAVLSPRTNAPLKAACSLLLSLHW